MKEKVYENLSSIYISEKGLSNYAFSLYLFIIKLKEKCIKDEIEDIFFLSREGAFLKKLYDNLEKDEKKNINTHYMYISRKAIINATLDDLSIEKFEYMQVYKDLSLYMFLKGLNFNDEEIDFVLEENKNTAKNLINDYFYSKEFKNLKSNKLFVDLYEKKRREYRNNLEKYLSKIGYSTASKIAIVDVGWNGTIQDGLYKLNKHYNLFGYYIGTTNKSKNNTNKKYGLLFDCISMENPFCFERYIYEYICVANHGGTDGYDEKGNPILLNDADNELYEQFFKKIQEEILIKCKEINLVICKTNINEIDLEYFIKYKHAKMLLFLSGNNKRIIKNAISRHPDNFINKKSKKTLKNIIYYYIQKMKLYFFTLKCWLHFKI